MMTGLPFVSAMTRRLERFRADPAGATAIEYGLIAGGIAVAIAATIVNLGTEVKTQLYDKLTTLF
jgi:pilus assembly protein Flp/PilA